MYRAKCGNMNSRPNGKACLSTSVYESRIAEVTAGHEAKSLWINLELAKKPVKCIEFILVHELVHLIERHHNERFKGIMDKHLPNWRERRSLLNSLPLAYEDWSY